MEKKSQITFFYLQEKLKKGVMLVTFIALSLVYQVTRPVKQTH